MNMKQIINKLLHMGRRRMTATLTVILLAAALIELLSLVQYRYARNMLEEELDYRVESELTLKSVRVRGLLKSNEKMVRNYLWPVQRQLAKSDANTASKNISQILHRLVATNHGLMSAFVAFKPGYLDGGHTSRLTEPCAIYKGDSIITCDLATTGHDYTQREFYHQTVENGVSCWSDPYLDANASGQQVTTYATPLVDERGELAGTFGLDMSTQGIIDTLNTVHNFPSSFFLLLTEDGRLISQPDTTHTQQSDVATIVEMINDSTCQRKPSCTGISEIITFNDKEMGKGYAYCANMKGKPHWQLVMVCYDKEVFGKLNAMRRNLMLLMLGAFSLLGFILYRFNQSVQRLNKERLSQERTASELRIAQTIQSEMLPGSDITRPDVDVSGRQISALEVGGDLYDYFIRDEKLFFCIGDVSGKGIPSSLVMAVAHSLFRSLGQHESSPSHIMQAINAAASEDNGTGMFVTLFVGVLDLPTGRLRYCNAGHDAPLVIEHDVKPLPVTANLPVGVYGDFKYVQQETVLPDNAILFLFTDGLTEAGNTEHVLYGMPRVLESATRCMKQGLTAPGQLMETMKRDADLFTAGADQSDDLTMLAVHYHRPAEVIVLDETLKLTNNVRQVPELNEFVKTVAGRLNLDTALSSQLMLAVEEAVVNVMSYAYPLGTEGDITVTARATEQSLKFIIIDSGKAFDPTQRSSADVTLSAEERPIGGLGILLVQQLMDTINYEHIDGQNVLTLKKELGVRP